MYLELACHDEQNGGQRFALRPRITELWELKGQKVESINEENCLSFFKVAVRQY